MISDFYFIEKIYLKGWGKSGSNLTNSTWIINVNRTGNGSFFARRLDQVLTDHFKSPPRSLKCDGIGKRPESDPSTGSERLRVPLVLTNPLFLVSFTFKFRQLKSDSSWGCDSLNPEGLRPRGRRVVGTSFEPPVFKNQSFLVCVARNTSFWFVNIILFKSIYLHSNCKWPTCCAAHKTTNGDN